jgi:hypothetical protein
MAAGLPEPDKVDEQAQKGCWLDGSEMWHIQNDR